MVHQSGKNKSTKGRPAYTFHVVERSAKFSPDNWIQEGPGAPFVPLYTTDQMVWADRPFAYELHYKHKQVLIHLNSNIHVKFSKACVCQIIGILSVPEKMN